MKHTQPLFFLLLIPVLWLAACGPSVTRYSSNKNSVQTVAVLPLAYETELAEERRVLLYERLRTALAQHGYRVVISEVISDYCSSHDCSERVGLEQALHVDAVVDFSIASLAEANFLGGYFSRLSGTVRLLQGQGPLISVGHAVSERGGFLFNSGQVLKGLESQVERFGDSGFDRLAQKLIAQMVRELPSSNPNKQNLLSLKIPVIEKLHVSALGPRGLKVCLNGTPAHYGTILIESRRVPLREVQTGFYCGAFRRDFKGQPASVELKSTFGLSTRKAIHLSEEDPCRLAGKIAVDVVLGKGVKLEISDQPGECRDNRYVVYRSVDTLSRPLKVAEFSSLLWFDKESYSDPLPLYFIARHSSNDEVLELFEVTSGKEMDTKEMMNFSNGEPE
jgi:hypothetical protein